MQASTVAQVLKDRQIPLLFQLSRELVNPLYRAAFLASAAGSGILQAMRVRPCDPKTLAERLGIPKEKESVFTQWLDVGVQLGELRRSEGCYSLKSRAARALATTHQDAVAAALEEVTRFHFSALMDLPSMLKQGALFALRDQDGEVIARSTRVVKPFVEEAIRRAIPAKSAVRLLEVGCGSGDYVRYAAERNPDLSALAIDLQEEVAAGATDNMAGWGLSHRVEVRHADFRALDVEPQFDVVTMHNNIYYFPVAERVKILSRVRRMLAPGGTLLLTTSCRGGNMGLAVLDLWFQCSDFGGALPDTTELCSQLREAGFETVDAQQLIPGDKFYGFYARSRRASFS